jgi:serine/threonine-protein kinase HipA
VSEKNIHGLLEQIGVECAGAVVIIPQGQLPPDPAEAEFEWLTEDELVQRLRDLPNHPLGIRPGRVRLSLGGVQEKLVLTRAPSGRFAEPLNGAPSTHIIKPAQAHYVEMVANEAFCLRVANCAGLSVARAEVERFGDLDCLIVERFDRTYAAGNRIERLHQEDFCQALGVLPDSKYEDEGGPSIGEVGDAIRRLSLEPARDVLSFARAVVLNYVVGNSDAHGKNFALLYDPVAEARLAPFYDLVSTAVYDVEQKLAMAIGGEFEPEQIAGAHWRLMAAELGMAEGALAREISQFAERVRRCAVTVREQAVAEEWHKPIIDRVVAIAERRAARIIQELG